MKKIIKIIVMIVLADNSEEKGNLFIEKYTMFFKI